MSLAAPEIVRPAFCWAPEHDETWGPDAAELAGSVGLVLDPEQRLALDTLLARKGSKWAALEACIIEARQNGKTSGVLLPAALADLFLFGARLVVWSAHKFDTAQEAFREFDMLVSNWDHLAREVKRVWRGNGDESIELRNGARLKFRARTLTGGRGLSGDRVVLDEAFALEPAHMGALMPTLSARPDPQLMYGSSAGLATSAVLRGVRDRGRRGWDDSLAYLEWAHVGGCADDRCQHAIGTPGCALDDMDCVRCANHTLGRRITEEYIRSERRAFSATPEMIREWARERLGWWDDPADASREISEDVWAGLAPGGVEPVTPVAFAVDATPGGAWASIGLAGGDHVDLVDHRAGLSWVVGRAKELHERHRPCAWVLDPASPASPLIPELLAAGIELVTPTGAQVGQATGGLLEAVRDGRLRHPNNPLLNAAVAGAQTKQRGDVKVWSRRESTVDISPLVAVTLARWAWAVKRGEGTGFFAAAWR